MDKSPMIMITSHSLRLNDMVDTNSHIWLYQFRSRIVN